MSQSTTHPGRITINTGSFSEDTCVAELDLIRNQAKKPAIRQMMEYANRRSLTTLLVSGVVTPYGLDNSQKTKLGKLGDPGEMIAKGKSMGNNAYQFPVMGRIEKASVIRNQVGASGADGRFTLLMNDRHLYDGMNCKFHNGYVARVEGNPTGSSAAGYLVNFWAPSGDVFVYSTVVAPQAGTKTCFGMYTSYSENSKKGDSRSKFADMFVNNTTIQRKTCAITGTAASQVLWYTFTDAEGGSSRGWMHEELAQGQATFLMEDERQKWFGVSDMKNSDGTLKSVAPIDPTTGYPITQGDGVHEQLAGGNVLQGSGTNGEWTYSDLTEIMKQLEKKSDKLNGLTWVMVTGTDGFANFQTQCKELGVQQNITFFNQVDKDGRPGGPLVDVGYNFASFNVNGNQMICVKHPLFDDELLFTERGADGNILMSSTAYVLNIGSGANKNMEILYKAANGISRQNVTARLNGLTGDTEMSVSEEDSMKYALLKEDLIVIYNTPECGILEKAF